MQVILLHPRFTQAKSLTLTGKHIAMVVLLFLAGVASCAALMLYLLPFLQRRIACPFSTKCLLRLRKTKPVNRFGKPENLAVMTARMGETCRRN